MSHGSCVAALAGVVPLPAMRAPTASAAAARVASSARLACLGRGLTVIVESAFLLAEPVKGPRIATARPNEQARASRFVTGHNLSSDWLKRLMGFRLSASVSVNNRSVKTAIFPTKSSSGPELLHDQCCGWFACESGQ